LNQFLPFWPRVLLLPQTIQILLSLVAANLVLERIDPLLALQIVDLLLLAQGVGLALDSIDLLIGLQALQLLIVFQLVQLSLRLRGVGLLPLRRLRL